jgi:hypothetical protein
LNYLPRRRSLYPAQDSTSEEKFNPRMNIVFMHGMSRKIRNKKKAGNDTNKKNICFLKTSDNPGLFDGT